MDKANSRGYERIDLDVWSFNQDAQAAFQKLGIEVYNGQHAKKKDQALSGGFETVFRFRSNYVRVATACK